MRLLTTVILLIVIIKDESSLGVSASPTGALIVKRQGEVFEAQDSPRKEPPSTLLQPKIERMHVTSNIEYRYANTLISSRVLNPANASQEASFTVTLPENAFISKFVMEVDGKAYEATVKEKEEAKKEYDSAVSAGQGAAHVAVSARDSNRFTVSVNVEPNKEVTFNLTYEELLTRRLGSYNQVINLSPGQVVDDLKVDVFIKEDNPITGLRVPELRSGDQVDPDENTPTNTLAKVEQDTPKSAHISFAPSVADQRRLGQNSTVIEDEFGFGSPPKPAEGLGGQFVVQYDVDRSEKPSEVLVNNGYFVHFFAPQALSPLPKHAIFVLDVSGSMDGRKMDQMKEAMKIILTDLNNGDFFNIIEFSDDATVWNLDAPISNVPYNHFVNYNFEGTTTLPPPPEPVPAYPATPEYISKAKDLVSAMLVKGGTNIHDALTTAIRVAHESVANVTNNLQSTIVFLTDGQPSVGITGLDEISSAVIRLNHNPEATIFSLAFGDNADLDFLKKLSLRNGGFARKIYEASDAALQLRDFYRQISSPLLANVTFRYQPDLIDNSATTKTNFNTLFLGSEIVVAGRINSSVHDTGNTIEGDVSALSKSGDFFFDIGRPIPIDRAEDQPVSSLERLWAYLTIRQLLEEQEAKSISTGATQPGASNETQKSDSKEPKKEALRLALKYSFVTPLTSLVVVKPDNTKETGDIRAAESSNDLGFANYVALPLAAPMGISAKFAVARTGVPLYPPPPPPPPFPPYGAGGPGAPGRPVMYRPYPISITYDDAMLESDVMDSQPFTTTTLPPTTKIPNFRTLVEGNGEEIHSVDPGATSNHRTEDSDELGDDRVVKEEGDDDDRAEKEEGDDDDRGVKDKDDDNDDDDDDDGKNLVDFQNAIGKSGGGGALVGSWSGPWNLPLSGPLPGCQIGQQLPNNGPWVWDSWQPWPQTYPSDYWRSYWEFYSWLNGFISGIGNVGTGNVGLYNNGWGNNGWGNLGWGNVGLNNNGWGNNGWGNDGWGNTGWGNVGWGNNGWGITDGAT